MFLSDCTAPFAINIFTDKLDDLGATGGTNVEQSRGKWAFMSKVSPVFHTVATVSICP